MVYLLHYDIAAFIIIITVMIHFYYKKTINTRQTKLFSYLISVALLSTLLDILSSIAIQHTNNVPILINYLLCEGYFITFKAIPAIYFRYVVSIIKGTHHLTKGERLSLFIPYFIEIILILTTFYTELIFYFDEFKMYHRGPLLIFLYIVDIIYISASLWYAFKYRSRLTSLQRGSVYFYTISMVIAVCVQFFLPDYLLIEFATSLSILLIYLSLENPESYEDKQLGVFNILGFNKVLNTYFENEQHFEVLTIQIQGLQYVNDIFGVEYSIAIMQQIAKYLGTQGKGLKLFYTNLLSFALVGNIGKEEWDSILKDIRNRFKYPFMYRDVSVMVSGLFCMVECPKDVNCLKDTLDIIEYSLAQAKLHGSDVTVYATKESLYLGRRENRILQILKKSILEDGFDVYYQPIYSEHIQGFKAAEALIRLKDQSQGFISPEEFIPIAEKNGLILEIGEIIFRKVCAFISENRIWEKGIQCVDVNLSVVQCMQESLHETLIRIMDEYGLEYHYIALEVTETVAAASSEPLLRNMQIFNDLGMQISLDDYGTGFSNTASLVQFPFAAIKLDKSILWSALDSMKATLALMHTIDMIRDMDMSVIAEGVETREQADMLIRWGCDLHQGYFYSRPLSGDAFIKLLSTKCNE